MSKQRIKLEVTLHVNDWNELEQVLTALKSWWDPTTARITPDGVDIDAQIAAAVAARLESGART